MYSESCFPVKSFCLSFDLFLSFDKNIDSWGKRATRDNSFFFERSKFIESFFDTTNKIEKKMIRHIQEVYVLNRT